MEEVRKSIARISFEWKCRELKDSRDPKKLLLKSKFKNIVLPGTIVSMDNDVIVILDGTFFGEGEKLKNLKVELPNPTREYVAHDEKGLKIIPTHIGDPSGSNDIRLCALRLSKSKVNIEVKNFIQPINMETQMATQGQIVHIFSFPLESHVTPTAYCPGSIIDAHGGLVVHGCHIHEFAHFGSPLFNQTGHLIGICCGSQARTHSYSVQSLQYLFNNSENMKRIIGKVCYLDNGNVMCG